jgi:hypothetical protein
MPRIDEELRLREPPYEYCAMRFLSQWERTERYLYEMILSLGRIFSLAG